MAPDATHESSRSPPCPYSSCCTSRPSAWPSRVFQGADYQWHAHETPRAMSIEEIEEVVRPFGNAAALAKKAGFDGVEVHAGSGYLLDTFLQVRARAQTSGRDAALPY